jgi:hypothetical protein
LGQGFLDRLGRASLTTSFDAGTSSVTCSYPGDAVNDAGTSPPVSISVRYPTGTRLSVAPPIGVRPLPVALVAEVFADAGQPSGTVTFLDNGRPIGTESLVVGRAALTATLAAGTHLLLARYNGDDRDRPSASSLQSTTVTAS